MLNFKDWKLASQDGQKATLKHANGHEMTIAMKALPKIQREQIMRLAKVQTYKVGGEVQHFDDNPDGVQAATSADAPQKPPLTNPPPVTNTYIISGGAAQPVAPTGSGPVQNPAAMYGNTPQPEPIVEQKNLAAPVPNLNPVTGQVNPTAVSQNAQQAVLANRDVEIARANAARPIEAGYIRGVSENQKNAQDLYNQMTGHVEDFNKYIKSNPINPNAYVENMNAGKKTTSALGLVLGGMGAGMLGSTDNPALRYLNSQIDRDIAGQQARVNNQRTVLGAYQDLYGQGVVANNLTKASLLDIYSHKLQLLADQLGTPQAKAAALKFGADAALEKQGLLKTTALDITSAPGTSPTSSEGGSAANIPHGTQTPGQQGPTVAQAPAVENNAPSSSGEFVDANGRPVDTNKLSMAGISKDASGEDLQAKGIYPKEHPRAAQLKDITTQEIPSILRDDVERIQKKWQYDSNKTPEIYREALKQKQNAAFVDQNLKQMNKLYAQAIEGSEKSGLSGRFRDAGSSVIGGLTGAVGSVFGHGAAAGSAGAGATGALDTREIRLRDNALQGLESIINASLNGVKGVDADTVHRWVQGAKPVYGDTPHDIKVKYQNLIDLVKGHVLKDQIKDILR